MVLWFRLGLSSCWDNIKNPTNQIYHSVDRRSSLQVLLYHIFSTAQLIHSAYHSTGCCTYKREETITEPHKYLQQRNMKPLFSNEITFPVLVHFIISPISPGVKSPLDNLTVSISGLCECVFGSGGFCGGQTEHYILLSRNYVPVGVLRYNRIK